jgi:alkylation response protein AidB-like acyl-CoA dehydrogenase
LDFELTRNQQDVLDGLARILRDLAGPERSMVLSKEGAYDFELHAALVDTGFLSVARDSEFGFLQAALVAEAVAEAGGIMASAAAALVVPALLQEDVEGPVALAERHGSRFVRFAAHATTLLGVDGDEAVVVALEPGEVEPVKSTFGAPVGRLADEMWDRSRSLGPGSAEDLVRWWRVAISAEQVGLMSAALRSTVAYLNERVQFGHPIASFQAVQHRLAECAVLVEGARWLTREASALGAAPQAAAAACAHATLAGQQIAAETHQLSGAIGFTKENGLHVYTTRLRGLGLDLGGADAHCRALAHSRWSDPTVLVP